MPDLDELLDQVPALAGPRRVEELAGGLTNRNFKVTVGGSAFVVRRWHGDASLLAIDRDHEHLNSVAAAQAGVGAEVFDYRPDLGILVIGFLEGRTLGDADFADPEVLGRAAEACRRLHAGPRFANDFDMFSRQAGYLETIKQNGFPLPTGYDDHAGRWDDVRRVLTATAGPTVPCNNDLLAGNFIDDGDRIWLIDYEYSGNNDPCFELGNTSTECEFTAGADGGLHRGLLRHVIATTAGPGAAAGAVQRVRLVTVGVHPGRDQLPRVRLRSVGDAPLREGGPHLHQPGLRPPDDRGTAR